MDEKAMAIYLSVEAEIAIAGFALTRLGFSWKGFREFIRSALSVLLPRSFSPKRRSSLRGAEFRSWF
jgi:hypothetical protein